MTMEGEREGGRGEGTYIQVDLIEPPEGFADGCCFPHVCRR